MATKIEKIAATKATLACTKSKYQNLQKQFDILTAKIQRLQTEQSVIKNKAAKLQTTIVSLETYLKNNQG